jgi:uncharacterized membrane protein (UPF0127 family)
VTDVRTGLCLGERVERVDSFLGRLRGLLGRSGLAEGEGMILEGCAAVHTAFMRFPLDLCFLDREARVLKVVRSLPPWRAARARGASHVVEFPAGTVARADVRAGDLLELRRCA